MSALVLVADQDEAARSSRIKTLAEAGYRIHEVATAAAALAALNQQPVALAVLHADLPDMSGSELCGLVKQRHPAVMVLRTLTTFPVGQPSVPDLRVADGYLVEPILEPELVVTARTLLRVRNAEAALQDSELRFAHFRQEAETQRELLVRELNHRVNNTLAIVQALATQSRLRATSPEEFDRVFTARLLALARTHDLLTRANWQGVALAELVQEAIVPFAGDDIAARRTACSGPTVWLEPNLAVTMSLAFHELAANAAAFGALSNSMGQVAIAWTPEGGEPPGAITLSWEETGGPAVLPPARKGFGSVLIEQALAAASEGNMVLSFPTTGVNFRIRLPLSNKIRLV